jgi:hypothetical protein
MMVSESRTTWEYVVIITVTAFCVGTVGIFLIDAWKRPIACCACPGTSK